MLLRLFNREVPLRKLFFVIGEGLLIFLAILLAAYIRFGDAASSFWSLEVAGKACLIVFICQTSLYYNELYALTVSDTFLEMGIRMTNALGVASILVAIIYYLFPSVMIGRGIFFPSLVFIVFLVVPWRFIYSYILKTKKFAEKILVLGQGHLSAEIVKEIHNRPDAGYLVSAVVASDQPSNSFVQQHVPFFSMNGNLFQLASRLRTNKIVVALDEKRGRLPIRELLTCKTNGVPIIQGETLYEELTGKLFLERLNPSWLIFSEGFRKSTLKRFFKRISGLTVAFISLIITLPIFCLVCLAIKLDSKGPILFKQKRIGLQGKVYSLFKFRSMFVDAEEISGPVWATEDDPRTTRVGRFLRKFRLDELPQLWNVLKGEMDFVGPRPERPEFVEKLVTQIPYYSERHTVKPGITGWAQVCYHYGASVDESFEKLKYDLFYVKNMSFALDTLIMLKTIKIVLLQSGAR